MKLLFGQMLFGRNLYINFLPPAARYWGYSKVWSDGPMYGWGYSTEFYHGNGYCFGFWWFHIYLY